MKIGTDSKYRFGIGIFLVYQFLGYQLASLPWTPPGSTGMEYKQIHRGDV